MKQLRIPLACLVLTAVFVVPMFWMPPGVMRMTLGLLASLPAMVGLFVFVHWVLEKVSPAPYEPFIPERLRDRQSRPEASQSNGDGGTPQRGKHDDRKAA